MSKSLSRKKKGSRNRKDAAARLGRRHHRVANVRRHVLHHLPGGLVKTHDRIVIENLNVTGMLANHRLARAICDAGWSEFARMPRYQQAWRGGRLVEADRWHPSTRLCPLTRGGQTPSWPWPIGCSAVGAGIPPTQTPTRRRIWPAGAAPITRTDPRAPKQEAGPPLPADGTALANTHVLVKTSPDDAGTDLHTAPAA
ncbi:transposase [Mycobacterium sp. SM1]|nr:transposase [Mycobacterium sp. SM1]